MTALLLGIHARTGLVTFYGPALVASLRKGRDDAGQMLEAVAAAYLAGAELNWRAAGPGRLTDLRSAQWQRQLRSSGSTCNSGDLRANVTLRRISNYFCHPQTTLAK